MILTAQAQYMRPNGLGEISVFVQYPLRYFAWK
jgi:hypothetical protein